MDTWFIWACWRLAAAVALLALLSLATVVNAEAGPYVSERSTIASADVSILQTSPGDPGQMMEASTTVVTDLLPKSLCCDLQRSCIGSACCAGMACGSGSYCDGNGALDTAFHYRTAPLDGGAYAWHSDHFLDGIAPAPDDRPPRA